MINYLKDKKNIAILFIVLLILVVIVLIFISIRGGNLNLNKQPQNIGFRGWIIDDAITIPDTTSITSNEGEIVPRGKYNIKIQPQSEVEQVYVVKAKLTLKEAYSLAQVPANNWASDRKLIFIKSNGAIDLKGLSSSWQLVFGSKQKNSGYEIIIQEDKIVSQKEIESKLSGFDLPLNWYDDNEAITTIE